MGSKGGECRTPPLEDPAVMVRYEATVLVAAINEWL